MCTHMSPDRTFVGSQHKNSVWISEPSVIAWLVGVRKLADFKTAEE